ncbi:MAG: CDGSH iron-sulfur domain-containing protein [Chloroflexota bacterium]
MSDKYTGKAQDRRYTGDDVDITFSLKRCIHARECVNRLSEVFDVEKRPWINPDGASADEIATVVRSCPSGALHYDRKDGGEAEPTPETNRFILWQDGPVQVIGDLSITGATVDIAEETRATLCRCGASEQKPFCDNSHKKIDFVAEPFESNKAPDPEADVSGKMTLTPFANGPVGVEGNFQIEDADGNVLYKGTKTALCRCGHSSSKPFCDGTHHSIDFQAD